MFEEQNAGRPATKRELRLLDFLKRMLPPYRHWAERARERERHALRGGLGALPKAPRQAIGAKEWEARMLALNESGKPPTCVDRAELGLSPKGETKCARTGLVLARGRCPECPCPKSSK